MIAHIPRVSAPQVPGFQPRYNESTGLELIDQMHNTYNWQDAMIQMGRNQQDKEKAPGFFTRLSRNASDAVRYAQRERPTKIPGSFEGIRDTYVPSRGNIDAGIYKPQKFPS